MHTFMITKQCANHFKQAYAYNITTQTAGGRSVQDGQHTHFIGNTHIVPLQATHTLLATHTLSHCRWKKCAGRATYTLYRQHTHCPTAGGRSVQDGQHTHTLLATHTLFHCRQHTHCWQRTHCPTAGGRSVQDGQHTHCSLLQPAYLFADRCVCVYVCVCACVCVF